MGLALDRLMRFHRMWVFARFSVRFWWRAGHGGPLLSAAAWWYLEGPLIVSLLSADVSGCREGPLGVCLCLRGAILHLCVGA